MIFDDLLEQMPSTVTLPLGDEVYPSRTEEVCHELGYKHLIGVDEVGRGPLAGPVTVCATYLGPHILDETWASDLNDSKKLSERKREALYEVLFDHVPAYFIASRDSRYIDENRISNAIHSAMEEAVSNVVKMIDIKPDLVLIDGNEILDIPYKQVSIKKGDAKSLHIGAASILAKVYRDRKMVRYHEKWPEYGFDSHKGYGTQQHRTAIQDVGPCRIHRLSFGGVKEHANRLREKENKQ